MEGVVINEEDTIVSVDVLNCVLKGCIPVGSVIIREWALILLLAPRVANAEQLSRNTVAVSDLVSTENSVGM